MSAHQAVFPIKTMARVFKGPASGYYDWRGRPASLRACQLLLGHAKLKSTVRYLGLEVDDALLIFEQTDL